MNHSKQIIDSWQANAENWIKTIDGEEIESRRLATNDAIINAVVKYAHKSVLDLGCGEGWLSRTVRKEGIDAWGTDAIQQLVDKAISSDGEFYSCCSYEDIIAGNHSLPTPFDAVVINFALLDKEVTENLIKALPALINKNGYLIIQTVHPLSIGNEEYIAGWKEGSWKGFKQPFVLPYKWYFRTFAGWINLFMQSGFVLEELVEPMHPQTGTPLSVIFVLKLKSSYS